MKTCKKGQGGGTIDFIGSEEKMKTKIGIVGIGYVGNAVYNMFKHHYKVALYDPKFVCATSDNLLRPRQIAAQNERVEIEKDYAKKAINACDVVFVCVPTPEIVENENRGAVDGEVISGPRMQATGDDFCEYENGKCDTSIVEEVVSWVEAPLIIIKSTVSPGTTDRLKEKYGKNIVFAPEYCGESFYWTPYKFHKNMKEAPWFTFGGSPEDTSKCVDLYMPVCGPTKVYRQTTALAAEVAKYMENAFYAMKITFCYEFAEICDAVGADYNDVRELWLLDPRINPMHSAVFASNDFCFKGKCLPKDLKGIISAAYENGYDAKLLKQVWKSNLRIGQLRKNRKGTK